MADFDNIGSRMQSVRRATNLVGVARSAYEELKTLRTAVQLYQSGADPIFNAAVDKLYTPTEIAKLAAMISSSNTLLTAWENTRMDVLSDGGT